MAKVAQHGSDSTFCVNVPCYSDSVVTRTHTRIRGKALLKKQNWNDVASCVDFGRFAIFFLLSSWWLPVYGPLFCLVPSILFWLFYIFSLVQFFPFEQLERALAMVAGCGQLPHFKRVRDSRALFDPLQDTLYVLYIFVACLRQGFLHLFLSELSSPPIHFIHDAA